MHDDAPRLYVAGSLRALDAGAQALGHGAAELMRRAAAACWDALCQRHGVPARIAVLCGTGNNGGDGYEIARLAQRAGAAVRVHAPEPPRSPVAAAAAQAWRDEGGAISGDLDGLDRAPWIVDALLGIGLSRPPAGACRAAIEAIGAARAQGARVLAVDLPSGLDASTGHAPGAAVQADLTVSFIGRALGLYTARGPALCGERVFSDLGLPPSLGAELKPSALLQRKTDLALLRPRPRDAHKGQSGHVLIVGGNHGMAGAALLAGRAALRSGAGRVSLATRPEHAAALTAAQPELMVHGVRAPADLDGLLQRASVVALGPGLGEDEWARALWAHLLGCERPLVLDADALNLLARLPRARSDWVLTPHPGEAARLLQSSTAAVQADRPAALAALQQRYGGSIVLKGAGTLVSGAPPQVCPYGNPGMAVAGMGDALTGVIAALCAQDLPPAQAAALGVLVHALAGDRAAGAGERGLLTGELIQALRSVVNPA